MRNLIKHLLDLTFMLVNSAYKIYLLCIYCNIQHNNWLIGLVGKCFYLKAISHYNEGLSGKITGADGENPEQPAL